MVVLYLDLLREITPLKLHRACFFLDTGSHLIIIYCLLLMELMGEVMIAMIIYHPMVQHYATSYSFSHCSPAFEIVSNLDTLGNCYIEMI